MPKWKYTVDATIDEPIMLLNKHFGMDEEEGEGIMGNQFQEELMRLDTLGKKRIKVYINSPGGSVLDGMLMYHSILATKTKVDTYNGGVAASIAGVVFQAGRTRYMTDYSLLMMHNPFNPNSESSSTELQAFKGSLIKMLLRKNPTTTEEQVSDFMNNTTWMNADDALKNGFVDVVESSDDMNKPRSITATSDTKATWKQYSNYFNSLNNQQIKPKMKELTNFLKLNDSANEGSILEAIKKIQNKSAEDEIALATAKAELAASVAKIVELEAKIATDNAAKDAETAIATENAATLLVENAAKIGKIKNDVDTIKKIKAQAIKDFEGTKDLLDSLPINKAGFEMKNKLEGETVAAPYSMQTQMIKIKNGIK